MSALRRGLALAVAALAVLGVVALPVAGERPADVARAADTRQFDAGNIITDQLFFNGSAMSAAQVQTFLNVRNPDCVAGSDGTPCLKNYRMSTPTMAADPERCPSTYAGATSETAATIIAKIGRACGISQRVLLVMLQKEQSLVTDSGSTLYARRYREAMGYACPDTASCNPAYAGFFRQVYTAAGRFKYYAAHPTDYNHRAGQWNSVRFHPNVACGSSNVFIRNQATAGLYNYTPYQPNAAALAAGKGTGDACSAYGNRNFWIYFTDWFGSTQTAGAGDLADLYISTGAERGPLGAVTQPVTCGLRNGGCKQGYANGWIFWSPSTGARAVLGAVKDLWVSTGAEHGVLGYPTQSVSNAGDGRGQYALFEGGAIYWTATTGARAVLGPIKDYWASTGGIGGSLGYPTQSVSLAADGKGNWANFERGSVYWSAATGARALLGPVRDFWASTGGIGGPLGYPTQSVSTAGDGKGQYARFQGGDVYWSPDTGAWALAGPVKDQWEADGAEQGALGYPTSDTRTGTDGASQYAHFQNGSLYRTGAGVLSTLTGPSRDLWVASGADAGPLGAPTSDTTTLPDGAGKRTGFQNGSVYWSEATGARAMLGPIAAAWTAAGAEQGPLGYPTQSVASAPDGVGQYAHFENGSMYWTPGTGVHIVDDPVRSLWLSTRAQAGPLGYPTTDVAATPDGKGQYGRFEHGSIWSTPDTGTRAMLGAVETLWQATGGPAGVLGYPTQSVSTASDGKGQYARFEHGSIYWSSATGARALLGPIETLWRSTGAERGVLGYPTQSVSTAPDGVGQYARFQGGSIYWSPSTGARAMLGQIDTLWRSTGAERGVLGYPTQSVAWAPDKVGQYAHFEHGSIYWSPATGARALLGPVLDRWKALGSERGVLRYPTQSISTAPDGVGQYANFQGGAIWWSPATGARAVRGAFLTAWTQAGGARGKLGYPTRETYAVTGGSRMNFQHGTITVASTGKITVSVR